MAGLDGSAQEGGWGEGGIGVLVSTLSHLKKKRRERKGAEGGGREEEELRKSVWFGLDESKELTLSYAFTPFPLG